MTGEKVINYQNFNFLFLATLTIIGLGFFDIFRFGEGGEGDATPSLSSLFVALSQQNFVQGLTMKALAQIWKKFVKNS